MDTAITTLVRFVARGFYDKSHVLVLDAVLIHYVLSEDDLMYLLGIQRKELRALCNKLVDDRLMATHVRKEDNPSQRLQTKNYYYIHTTQAIDSIKWKVHALVKQIKEEMSHYGNPQGYLCPRCKKKFSQLDAISLVNDDMSQFECDNCGFSLVEDDSSQQATQRQLTLEKLMQQFNPIISLLKKIDDSTVQENTFEDALLKAVPAQTSSFASYNMSKTSKRANVSSSLQSAHSKSQATVYVSINANDDNEDKEQKEKEERRQKAQQNALPSWHSTSTVADRESTPTEPVAKEELPQEVKQEPEDVKNVGELKDRETQDVLAAYYAELAEREAQEDDDDDDDDDLDDFEDIA